MNYIEKARKNTAIATIIGEELNGHAGLTAKEICAMLPPQKKEKIAFLQYGRTDYDETEMIGTITAMCNGSTGYLTECCDYSFAIAEPTTLKRVKCSMTDAFTGEYYGTMERLVRIPARYTATYTAHTH